METKQITGHCACIIPFYNEGPRLIGVLNTVSRVSNLDSVICVDGDSDECIRSEIRKRFPRVQYIRMSKNLGKTAAMWEGVKHTRAKYVMFVDADLRGLRKEELEQAVDYAVHHKEIGMIILRRIRGDLGSTWLRADTVFSGERILRRKDFLRVVRLFKPKNYQIEIAVNRFMIQQKQRVYWMPSSGINTVKTKKAGFFRGLWDDIRMHFSMIKFMGCRSYAYQTLFFCRKQAPQTSSRAN